MAKVWHGNVDALEELPRITCSTHIVGLCSALGEPPNDQPWHEVEDFAQPER